MPAACALEMIHTYSLIHDDLPAMDDDDLRRGRATSHVVFGEGLAILAGDGLQAEAFSLLAREPQGYHPTLMTRKLRVLALIASAAGPTGMVGGQAIDLAAVSPAPGVNAVPLDPAGLQAMHMRKTGALIRASVVAGAVMAGADERLTAAVDDYGQEIGLAFQIVDDILDVEGAAATLGKTAGKDEAAGKPTYPAFFGLDQARTLAAGCHTRAREALERAGLLDSRLDDIASWTSSHDKGMEGGSSDECELVDPTVGAKLPKRLELACHSTNEDWHNDDVDKRGMNDQERTDYLKWNGSRYDKP